jgi:NADH-quinone oxidoreductase subunit L
MLWPLRILAVLSAIGGVIAIDALYAGHSGGGHAASGAGFTQRLFGPFLHGTAGVIASVSGLLAVAIGFGLAYALYFRADSDPIPARFSSLSRLLRNRFYMDEIYGQTVIKWHEFLSKVADWFERWIIEGLGIGMLRGGTDFTGRALRLLQTGNLQTYAFLFALGVALLLYFVLGRT